MGLGRLEKLGDGGPLPFEAPTGRAATYPEGRENTANRRKHRRCTGFTHLTREGKEKIFLFKNGTVKNRKNQDQLSNLFYADGEVCTSSILGKEASTALTD